MADKEQKVQQTEPKAPEVATEHKAADHKTEAEKKSDAEFKAMRDAQEKMNHEVMEAQAKCKPTPTPEEVQKALEGHNVDVKEDHGAPEQDVHHIPVPVSKQIEVGNKPASYATRETKKD